jgi:hypothetical protein
VKGVDAKAGTSEAQARPDRTRALLKGDEGLRHATLRQIIED